MFLRQSMFLICSFAGCVVLSALPIFAKQDNDSANDSQKIEINDVQLQLVVNVLVASRDAGVVENLFATEGKKIEKGDVLVELDRDSFLAESAGAKSELEIAIQESQNDIDLRFAAVSQEVSQKVYQRSTNATKQFARSVSKTELERLKLEFERAKLSEEQAVQSQKISSLTVELRKARSDIADIRLKSRSVTSPVSGIVAQLYRQQGEWVQVGEPIARVINLQKLRISFRCQLTDADPDDIASSAQFTCQGKSYEATVVFASPEIDPEIQDFIVWAEVENSDGKLKPGMQGQITLQKETSK